MSSLRLADHEPPYYIGLQVKDVDSRSVAGRFGAVHSRRASRYRALLPDVRVGSYEFDSTSEPETFGFDYDDGAYHPSHALPLENDLHALKSAVWLVIDTTYKQALASFLGKRASLVHRPDQPDRPAAFTREAAAQHVEPPKAFTFDDDVWSGEVRRVTARLRDTAGILDAEMSVTAEHEVRHFASSEGTRLVTEQMIFGLHVSAASRAEDGALLEHNRNFYGASETDLPRGDALDRAVSQMISEMLALRTAPVLDPYTGPALLAPEATGVLFHETLGHRLEGHRVEHDGEGRTFKGQIGKEILPPFISLVDDPTLAVFRTPKTSPVPNVDVPLNGFYRYDEEGVPAQRVTLVDKGVLRGYLLSRKPVTGFDRSNGHGRGASSHMPVARMGNLMVLAHQTVPAARLKRMLLDEVKRQKKPYGILIKDIAGGNTNTASYGYQAFKGASRLVYRVHLDGREELVRGVEMVGTPLTAIGKIAAMGDDPQVFNGYCGAESGYVPVSAVAPSMLLREIELQRVSKALGRPPLLPSPVEQVPHRP